MADNRKKLDTRTVLAMKPDPTGKDLFVWDTQIPGFGVRMKPSGVAAWIYNYRTRHGEKRRYRIGKAGIGGITAKQARDAALNLQAAVGAGGDPSRERLSALHAVTVADLLERWVAANHNRKKANSRINDDTRISRHILPMLGTRKVEALTRADIEFMYDRIRLGYVASDGSKSGGEAAAIRSLSTLKAALRWAVESGLVPTDPSAGVRSAKPKRRHVPFAFDLVTTVGKSMRELSSPNTRTIENAIRFIALTGFRKMEALTLQWSMVDFAAHCIRLPDTKTGPQLRMIGAASLALLRTMHPEGAKPGDYVFPAGDSGRHTRAHIVSLRLWRKVTEKAGIKETPIHGLRHWFGKAGTELGYSSTTIGGLLGHTLPGVTAIYSGATDTLRPGLAVHQHGLGVIPQAS